jgi:integrase
VRYRYGKVQTSLTLPTEGAAKRFALDVETNGGEWAFDQYQRAEDIAHDRSLDEWAKEYLAALTISPASITNYRRIYERRWSPHLGQMKLSQIARTDVVAALKAQEGAPKTIADAWGVLATMLKVAVLDGHLDKSPALGVKLPKHEAHERAEHRYLNRDELLQVIADTRPRYQPLMWMLVGTGMRWSEATALTVGDVDLDAKIVRVTKAWKRDRDKGEWYVGMPKTQRSRRTITLPNEVAEAVRPLIEGRKKADRLFTNRRGEYVHHQTFYREHWRVHCTKNISDPRPRIHDLRHSHVAMLLAAGISLPVIQARLGHEKITTSIDTYGHLLPDLQHAAADAASRVMGGGLRVREIGPPQAPGDQAD